MDREPDREDEDRSTVPGGDEPEPEWAEQIREERKTRTDRLREAFDAFDGSLRKSKEPQADSGDHPHV
jgi:hypothetical protein